MALFPTISSGGVFCYTSSFGVEYKTSVIKFVNDAEQRWQERLPLGRARLVFTDISSYDRDRLQAFWQSYKGAYVDAAMTNTFELKFTDVSGNTYDWNYCIFETNSFTSSETKPGRVTLEMQVAQIRKN